MSATVGRDRWLLERQAEALEAIAASVAELDLSNSAAPRLRAAADILVASEIKVEPLLAEIERLRDVLRRIAGESVCNTALECAVLAREALNVK